MQRHGLRLERVSDDDLLARLADPSMHVYATTRLHLSDAEAYLRITVARVSRRFPDALAMLAQGRLTLSAIAKLAPHLREGEGEALLGRAVHKSKREIEILVAELAPRPDVPARMRRLPPAPVKATNVRAESLVPGGVCPREVSDAPARAIHPPAPPGTPPAAAVVAPIAPARFKVQFTAGPDLHAKISKAQALLRHQIPDGDLVAVFDRAMTLLVRELERARFAATPRPRKSASEADPTPSSRRIPDPIRRAVWMRDGGQCTFRDHQGQRCPARERIEFHHVVPFARGGDHGEANTTLMCSRHNAFQAEADFGADFMAARRLGAGVCSRPQGGAPPR